MRTVLLALCTIATLSTQAFADLTLASYVKAKEAYDRNDCKATLAYLKIYVSEDSAYLEANADVREKINKAMDHCESVAGAMLVVTGAVVVSPPKPELP